MQSSILQKILQIRPSDLPIPMSQSVWEEMPEEGKVNIWLLWIERQTQEFKNIIDLLEDFRNFYNFNQRTLAEIAGIGKNTITKYLHGERFPPGDKLFLIIDGMDQMGIPKEKCMEYLVALLKHHIMRVIE